MGVWEQMLMEARKGIGSSGARVTRGYKLPEVGTRNLSYVP